MLTVDVIHFYVDVYCNAACAQGRGQPRAIRPHATAAHVLPGAASCRVRAHRLTTRYSLARVLARFTSHAAPSHLKRLKQCCRGPVGCLMMMTGDDHFCLSPGSPGVGCQWSCSVGSGSLSLSPKREVVQ